MAGWLWIGVVLLTMTVQKMSGKFEKLGAFIGKGGAMSSLVGPGPNGTERLYVCYTYLSSLDLVAYEPDTGKAKVWQNSEGGAWAMETGPDGRLYLGTYFQGHILRLDPQTDRLDDLGVAPRAVEVRRPVEARQHVPAHRLGFVDGLSLG